MTMGCGPPQADKAQIKAQSDQSDMFTTYVLISESSRKRYIGQTSNLDKRLDEHNNGLSRYTKNRGPWRLEYSWRFDTRREAMKYEVFLKSGKGREFLNNLSK